MEGCQTMKDGCPKTKCQSKNVHFFRLNFYEVGMCKDCGYYFFNSFRPENGCCCSPNLIDVIKFHGYIGSTGKESFAIYQQCRECGWTQKRFPKKSKDADIRGEYNEKRHLAWIERKNQEAVKLNQEAKIVNNFWYKYGLYLSSSKWKKIREEVFERDKKVCQVCKKETATEVHHLHYNNVFKEQIEDLIAICYTCHKEQHKKVTLSEIMNLGNA